MDNILPENINGSENNNAKGKRLWLLLIITGVVAIVGSAAWYFYSVSAHNNDAARTQSLKELSIGFGKASGTSTDRIADLKPRLIDGVPVEGGQENLYPVGVMIENHIDSRPSAGLARANLVYEAEAEGEITRFLAFYASGEDIKKIGPVRSARPYYVDWAEELDAAYFHCGGSPDALAKLTADNAIDVNEFYNGALFWRDSVRPAPHNVYTSRQNIDKYLNDNNLVDGNFLPWEYKTEANLDARPTSQTVTIGWPAGYNVSWQYDQTANDYTRYLDNKMHQDENGDIVKAKNVIIQYIPARVMDAEMRLDMDVLGEGEALVCLDGTCQKGVWKKNKISARTRFYASPQLEESTAVGTTTVTQNLSSGEEFKFNPVTTLVEVVRPEVEVSIR